MNELIECPMCGSTLQEPVILPCSHTICRQHEKDTAIIVCPTCHADHEVPVGKGGFLSNAILHTLIEKKLARLDLGAEHTVAVRKLNELKAIKSDLERLPIECEREIDRVVGEMSGAIEARRDEAKRAIDAEADGLRSELVKYKMSRKSVLSVVVSSLSVRANVDVSARVEKQMEALAWKIPAWESELRTFERNRLKWVRVYEAMLDECEMLYEERERIKSVLFTDELDKLEVKKKKFCQEEIYPIMVMQLKMSDELKENKFERGEHTARWRLSASISKSESDGEDYLGVYLGVLNCNSKSLCVKFDLSIENARFPEKSMTKKFEKMNPNDFDKIGCHEFIKISELKANRELYDESSSSFTMKANIYKIEWIENREIETPSSSPSSGHTKSSSQE